MEPPAAEPRFDDIAALVAAGDEAAAFAQLQRALGWPRGKDLAELGPWVGLLGTLAEKRGAAALAALAATVVRDADNPDQLYDLGYALIDAGAPAVAATVLWRCLKLVGDSEEVVCELVSALETALAHGDAFAILDEREPLRMRSFMCQYLYAFNAAMTGRLDVTRDALAHLRATPDAPETEAMRAAIGAIVERADRIAGATPLDVRDLRGWHYVLTGGLLIHQSPYGFDAPMHGRYAYIQDSYARIATAIDRLRPLAAGVPCVYAPAGRDHEILAHAIAKRLGLPLAGWPTIGVPAPGLVVVYDLAELPRTELARLLQRRADQILFAHASPWTHDFPVAPDLTTLLYQAVTPPWGARLTTQGRGAADARPVEAIADEIAASEGMSTEELAADQPERWAALVARVWPAGAGTRSRLWAGGPVPSNRFE
jgi:hypothetical protein